MGALLAVDVAYDEASARAAGVVFAAWTDEAPLDEVVVTVDDIPRYEPGAFFKRELPCVRAVFEAARAQGHAIDVVVVDAYVDLAPARDHAAARPGLGRRVHEALGVAVVGVAKTRFHGAAAVEVLRGASSAPLFVTAAGLDVDAAARAVGSMHGPHRTPTLLARVDAVARGRASVGA